MNGFVLVRNIFKNPAMFSNRLNIIDVIWIKILFGFGINKSENIILKNHIFKALRLIESSIAVSNLNANIALNENSCLI